MTTSIITKAVNILRTGGLVAFPTETVYGLGGDATNPEAIRRIFTAKERPYDHPLIVHIADLSMLQEWAIDVPPAAMKLAQVFWPGPLTLILKRQARVLDLITGGQDTVGIRIPRHPIAQALLQAFGGGIAAPSANRFTHISPTTMSAVQEELGDRVDLILDGGVCEVGLESTIIDMSKGVPMILRPGMIGAQAITDVLGMPVKQNVQHTSVRAAGMHHLHYAPTTATQLINTEAISDALQTLAANESVAFVVHTDMPMPQMANVLWVSLPNNPTQYAHDLYHTLRSLDHQQFKRIIIERVPDDAEWDAIRDRLFKASR